MKSVTGLVSAIAIGAANAAIGGGVDRSGQSTAVLFQDGNYAELSFGVVSPTVSGTAVAGAGGQDSGNVAENFFQLGASYKRDINERLAFAVIYDQPFGANVDYAAGTFYPFAGSNAELKSSAVTGLLKYTTEENVSVFGGIRIQSLQANADVITATGLDYTGASDADWGFGYVVGAAYEIPDIALRAALTYSSSIEHELSTTESVVGGATDFMSTTVVNTPQSLNLELQSGIAEDTLLFGSVRWANWSEFDITPIVYEGATGFPLVSYDDDTFTYSIGIGRRINESLSLAATYAFEQAGGGFASNLGPTDGFSSLSIGATYTMDNMTLSGGINYRWIGDAQTEAAPFSPVSNFTDNSAISAGIRIGWSL